MTIHLHPQQYSRSEQQWLAGYRIHKWVSIPSFVLAILGALTAIWATGNPNGTLSGQFAMTAFLFFVIGLVTLVAGAGLRDDGTSPF